MNKIFVLVMLVCVGRLHGANDIGSTDVQATSQQTVQGESHLENAGENIKPQNPLAHQEDDLEIDSDSGVTCNKEGTHCSAQGKIKVAQGPWKMTCQKIDVTFKKGMGAQEVDQIHAQGHVHIVQESAGYDITAEQADYTHVSQIMNLYGNPVLTQRDSKLLNASHVQLRYAEGRATAQGRPTVLKGDKILQADRMELYFHPGAAPAQEHSGGGLQKQASRLDHMEAFGNVIVSSPQEIATGQSGRYDQHTDVAELMGDVTIAQCDRAIEGDRAVFNLKTGSSQMLQGGGSGHRVQAILSPRDEKTRHVSVSSTSTND